MACPICKATKKNFSIKVKDYEYDINFTALYSQCRSCESIYRTKPKKVEKEKIYYPKNKYLPLKGNIIYDFFKKKYAEYEKRKIFGYLNNFLYKRKITILDIGCGKGYLIKLFSDNKSFNCFGIDPNIITRKSNNLSFIKASYDNLNLLKKIKPNIIIINNFIEHIENLKIIKKIVYQMRKKCFLIILTPDGDSLARRKFANYWSGYHAPRHNVIFNSKSIKKIFPKSKNIKLKQFRIYDPFTNAISISNLIKQVMHNFVFNDLFKITFFLLHLFADIRQKNRILMIVKKD